MKSGVIDIGTNSVLLTIAEIAKHEKAAPLLEMAEITRLGECLKETGKFTSGAMIRTIDVLKKYKEKCNQLNTEQIIAVGTSAMRRAENSSDFIKKVTEECGFEIEVISGEREAELVWKSASRDFGEKTAVIDIGGGSTEIITKRYLVASVPGRLPQLTLLSADLGSVTLYEKFVKSDPIGEEDIANIEQAVLKLLPSSPDLSPQGRGDTKLIATAGTATTLAAIKLKLKEYIHSEVHGFVLQIGDIEQIIQLLKLKTIKERKQIPGLEPKRADVILPGAMILEAFMRTNGFNEVTVSDRGVRWGMIYEIATKPAHVKNT